MLSNGVYSVFKNTVEPRMSQTVVPVALRKSPYIIFYEKTEIVTNGLLKMCPRLEPQQHFEAACCSGITILAVARVSRSYKSLSLCLRPGWDYFKSQFLSGPASFALPPSSETQFSMTKHDPRFVRKSLSPDACQAKRAIVHGNSYDGPESRGPFGDLYKLYSNTTR